MALQVRKELLVLLVQVVQVVREVREVQLNFGLMSGQQISRWQRMKRLPLLHVASWLAPGVPTMSSSLPQCGLARPLVVGWKKTVVAGTQLVGLQACQPWALKQECSSCPAQRFVSQIFLVSLAVRKLTTGSGRSYEGFGFSTAGLGDGYR